MRKRPFLKTQLFFLVVVVGLLVWRMNVNPLKGEGFVHFSDMSTRHLYERNFEVLDTVVVTLAAQSAFETEASSSVLAVYPWIVNNSTQEVAWKPENGKLQRSGIAASLMDSLSLQPGQYTAYFSTYGPTFNSSRQGSFLGLKPHWTNNPGEWNLILATGTPEKIRVGTSYVSTRRDESDSLPPGQIWNFTPYSSWDSESHTFHVAASSQINIEAVASLCTGQCDLIELYKEPDTLPIWKMEESNSEPAGGGVVNRKLNVTVDLEPGVYRMNFEASSRQNHMNWSANPPWFPHDWGVRVWTTTPESIRSFDPWEASAPIVSMLQMGDGEDASTTLTVKETLPVVIYAMGELRSDDSKYDFGSIYKEGRAAPVWEMSYSKSKSAGGDDLNRTEMAIVTLDPGTYYVRYISDGSHSYNDWNKSRPNNPERWGIAVFPVNPASFNSSSVEVVRTQPDWMSEVGAQSADELGDVIMRHNRLADDVTIDEMFRLDVETSIVVVALGEINSSSSYDWGWIERLPSREKVWEMTYQNTVQGGGDSRNRRYYGTITLGPGEYVVHFETDLSHNYGDFSSDAPNNGSDWGITLYKKAE